VVCFGCPPTPLFFAPVFSRKSNLLKKGILMIKYSRLVLIFLVAFVVLLGCGQKRNPNAPANVTGKVTYKGSPVKGGNLTFHPSGGGVYSFTIRPDGTYSATDMPDGEMAVTINTESLNPAKKEKQRVYAVARFHQIQVTETTAGPTGHPAGVCQNPRKICGQDQVRLDGHFELGQPEEEFQSDG